MLFIFLFSTHQFRERVGPPDSKFEAVSISFSPRLFFVFICFPILFDFFYFNKLAN
jgi:hypothetical protein